MYCTRERNTGRENDIYRFRACCNKKAAEANEFAHGGFQTPRTDRFVAFVREQNENHPKSWAGMVAGASSPTGSGPPRGGKDGAVSASVASTTVAVVPAARPQISLSQIPVKAPRPAPCFGYPRAIL